MKNVLLYADDYNGYRFEILGSGDCIYYSRVRLPTKTELYVLVGNFRLFEDACSMARYKIEEMAV